MKVFLFGGAEANLEQVKPMSKLMEEVIQRLGVKQIFHIPFAWTESKEEWQGDWLHRYMHLEGVECLNAKNKEDIAKAQSPLIFISDGSNSKDLLEKIQSNPEIVRLIHNAQYIIGESAGAKVLAEYLRVEKGNEPSALVKGLGCVTGIEFDTDTFPNEYNVIGNGSVEIKYNSS